MAMKAYLTQAKGHYVVSGNQGENYTQLRVVSTESLGGIVTRVGNYKTPNPHSYIKSKSRGLEGSVRTFSGSFITTRSGAQPYVYNWSTYDKGFDDNSYNLAVASLYEEIRGTTDISVDLMQWRQIKEMISLKRRLVSSIAKHGRKMLPLIVEVERKVSERGKLSPRSRRARRLYREINSGVNALAQARLEYVYGWKPAADTMQSLARGVLRGAEVGMIKCRGFARTVVSEVKEDFSVNPKIPIRHYVTNSNRVYLQCMFNPRPGIIDNLSRVSSLNPISVAYELIPWSFVLDWAVDIGGWLRTMESAFIHGNEFVSGYSTRTQRCNIFSRGAGTVYTSSTAGTAINLYGTAYRLRFSRTLLSAAPFPTKPVMQLNFGLERSLNALALAKSTLLRGDGLISKYRR